MLHPPTIFAELENTASHPVEPPRGPRIIASVTDRLQQVISDSLGVQSRIDTDAILHSVTTAIAQQLPVACMAVLLKADPGTSRVVVHDVVRPAMARHIDELVANIMRPGVAPTTGLSQRVIETGGPFFLRALALEDFLTYSSIETRTYLSHAQYPMKVEKVTMLMVPMRSGPAIVGTLSMFDWLGGSEISEDDIEWMQSVADRVGLMIDSAQLRNRAIDLSERLVAFSDAALAITSSRDLRVTLKLILERAVASLHVDAADVLLIDNTDGAFYVAASSGFRSTAGSEHKLPTPPETTKRALLERRLGAASAIEWMGQQRRWVVSREGFRYYTASPLIVRDKVEGALEVFSRTLLEPDPEWTAFLDAMASQAAIAVDNATMHGVLEHDVHRPVGRKSGTPVLTDRELEILRMVVNGASNREVAETLHLSQNTIKFHIRQLLEKAGVSNRTELATRAIQQSWI